MRSCPRPREGSTSTPSQDLQDRLGGIGIRNVKNPFAALQALPDKGDEEGTMLLLRFVQAAHMVAGLQIVESPNITVERHYSALALKLGLIICDFGTEA
jgi:hypothetical protein